MKIRVKNIAGIAAAEIPLQRLTLVGGDNGAGKTTLLQAVAAALLQQWGMRGISKKTQAEGLVREGAEVGSILLEYDGGGVRIAYPAGTLEQRGTPATWDIDAYGIGAERYTLLDSKARLTLLARWWKIAPSLDDLRGALAANGYTARWPAEAVEAVWADIEEKGWDGAAKKWTDEGRRLTGAWTEATGTRWGEKLRLTWVPPTLYDGEEYSIEEAEQELAAAKAALLEAEKNNAITGDRRAALRATADTGPDLGRQAEAQQLVVDRLAEEMDARATALEAAPRPSPYGSQPKCPHCATALAISYAANSAVVLTRFEGKEPSREQIKAQQDAHDAAAAAHRAVVQELTVAQQRLGVIRSDLQKARDALRALNAAAGLADGDPAQVSAAQVAVDAKTLRLQRVKTLVRARTLSAEWDGVSAVADILAPDGLRKQVLGRRLAELSEALSVASQQAKMREVGIDDDGALTYGGRELRALSESEVWRCDFIMSLILAQRQRAPVLLVDRLDVLAPQWRVGVLQMLADRKQPALIGMTARDAKAMPDLAAAKIGVSVWLEQGQISTGRMAA